jgi:outer membrane protein OmpA-like peptidoglycan-associated protein
MKINVLLKILFESAMYRVFLLVCLGALSISRTMAQSPELEDARQGTACEAFKKLLDSRPKEILFGVDVKDNGDVYFNITNKDWLPRFLNKPTDGIAIDIVSKKRYDCSQATPAYTSLRKGEWLEPVYWPEIKKRMVDLGTDATVKIGKVSPNLQKEEIEGNLAFIKNGKVCYYSAFTDIDRSLWELLPMGLFADSLVYTEKISKDTLNQKPLIFTKKIQFIVPFPKNKAEYSAKDIKPLLDSLRLTDFKIKQLNIRAYTSVEGSLENNIRLQNQRANSMVKVLQQFQTGQIPTEISAMENWVEFKQDAQGTPLEKLMSLSHDETKKQLTDKSLLAQAENILSKHRKAVITIYLDKKTGLENQQNESLLSQFEQAVGSRDIKKATAVEQEIFDRISDGRLPSDYLNRLEIPKEKAFASLLNNHGIYRYMAGLAQTKEALSYFMKLQRLDPTNKKANYNVAALKLKLWAADSTVSKAHVFLNEIKSLRNVGIDISLVRRIIINYYITLSEQQMARSEYAQKDQSLAFIAQKYGELKLDDKDFLSLAKYLCYYSQCNQALGIIEKRLDKIDVAEDLLFYYINLMFYDARRSENQTFKRAIENGANINRKRFCHLFDAIQKGGASFQLLEDPSLKNTYCNSCR